MGVIARTIIPVAIPLRRCWFKCLAAVKMSGTPVGLRPRISRKPDAACALAEIMADAAVKAGAPKGLISCLADADHSTRTGELMRHPDTSVVLLPAVREWCEAA